MDEMKNLDGALEPELKEWETPELTVESIEKATQGGVIGDLEADDAFYS